MNPVDEQTQEKAKQRKNQIIFVVASFSALLLVGVVAFFALNKIKSQKITEVFTQDQFAGTAEISTQLQAECQSSAARLSKTQDLAVLETEYRQNAENCKDVYFAIENESSFRKEGMYADLVVDIANLMAKKNPAKAIELLQFARQIKSWDFYLGPVSCDSQHVLDAYIESYSASEEKACYKVSDIKDKVSPELLNKNFFVLSKMVPPHEVVWMGIPESDVGCPEKMTSVNQILKKLASGPISIDESQAALDENNNYNLNIKLSDKENLTLLFTNENNCLKLSSVLVPNLDVSE